MKAVLACMPCHCPTVPALLCPHPQTQNDFDNPYVGSLEIGADGAIEVSQPVYLFVDAEAEFDVRGGGDPAGVVGEQGAGRLAEGQAGRQELQGRAARATCRGS